MKKSAFYEKSYAEDFAKLYPKYKDTLKIISSVKPKRFLDLGCGDGSFIKLLTQHIPGIEAKGIDIHKQENNPGIIQLDIEEDKLPFKDNYFDAVFCGELIEHLYDTDHLLDEIYRVLAPSGICVLTTPNLGFWFNRLTLLAGFQPISTEVSLKHRVGYPIKFWKSEEDKMAGHIRPFTYKSIIQLIKLHGFKIKMTKGYGVDLQYMLGGGGRVLAKILNFLIPFKSTCYDIMAVISK